VFLDPSGRRWRKLRVVALVLLLPTLLAVVASLALASTRPSGSTGTTGPSPQIASGAELPVIGRGPLVRVLRPAPGPGGAVQGFDAATGALLRPLSDAERLLVGRAPLLVERYGGQPGPRTTPSLLLTFDGGPHPKYTERVLEVLERHGVRATFFVTGQAAAREPQLVRRIAAAGHVVGNRTLTYVNVAGAPAPRVRQELVVADRALRALTGRSAGFVRLPYATGDTAGLARSGGAVLAAQQQGYQVVAFDPVVEDLVDPGQADTRPLALPALKGADLTVRLHDGGGVGRQRTVDYLDRLIPYAAAQGYAFPALTDALPQLGAAAEPVAVTVADRAALLWMQVLLGWPHAIGTSLFWFAVLAVVGVSAASVTLALRRARRRRRQLAGLDGAAVADLSVTVLIAAYNEEKVIARTLASLAASHHPVRELLVVDDGSTDGTAAQVLACAAQDPRVRLISQQNTGKSGALNNGLRLATGDLVVTVDADTLVSADTVGNLVRHFVLDESGRLGAVAGVVRVGNRDLNLLTRWQSLEYLTQISVERAAHDALGAITIVPGACAVWRRAAVLSVGGYSEDTLAEDCDLSLSLHRAGWRVTQDDEALAYTEAPATLDDLLKQRVRWTFGTLQAITKHRSMVLRPRYGWLGMVVLPWYALSLLVPLLTMPFIAVMGVVAVRTQGWAPVAVYFAAFTLAHLLVAATGVRLARESWRHLLVVPVYRMVYEPLRAYLLYVSAFSALRGVKVGWNKLARAGTVQAPSAPVPSPAPAVPVLAPTPVPPVLVPAAAARPADACPPLVLALTSSAAVVAAARVVDLRQPAARSA
jgi:biofilm PGA synthesis N-glycosyltransferase PgaC